jgi:WD40 repeat protein
VAVLVAGIIVSASQALRAQRAERQVLTQLTEAERQGKEAQRQRDEVLEANKRVAEQSDQLMRMAASHCVEEGIQAEQDGDPGLALLWFARAARIDGANTDAAGVNRRRFGIAMREIPQPVDVMPCDVGGDVRRGLSLEWGPMLRLLDARSHRPVSGRSVLFDGPVNFAQFSSDGRYIIAACTADKQARLFDTATGELACAPMPHDYLGYIDFTPDGRYIVTLVGGKMIVRSVPDGKEVATLPSGWCRFSQDGKRIIIHEAAGSRVWETQSGKALTPFLPSTGYRVAIDRAGRRAVTTGLETRIWDASNGEPITPPIPQRSANWYAVEISPDGTSLLIGARNVWRIWSMETGAPLTPEFEQRGDAFWAAWSEDGIFAGWDTTGDGAMVRKRCRGMGPGGGESCRAGIQGSVA